MAPVTVVVMGFVGLLVLIGVTILAAGGAMRDRRACPRSGCRAMNRRDAGFCSQCGAKLR